MTREETKQVLMIIQATYPNYKPPDRTIAINAWTMALEEYPYKAVEIALKAYIKTDTSGFAPSPGQVIQKIHIAEEYTELSEMEAWTLVARALRNGIYGADQEFDKLPRTVQKAAVSPDNLNFNPRTLKGYDVILRRFIFTIIKFQSTYPQGVRPVSSAKASFSSRFQSTYPQGVRQYRPGEGTVSPKISIHVPSRGTT